MSDTLLRKSLIRLAHDHPEFRTELFSVLTASVFPPETIGEEHMSGADGGVGSDAVKPWSDGHFTQEVFDELQTEMESGALSSGEATPVGKFASDKVLRSSLIRLASTHPEFRSDLLPILASTQKTAGNPVVKVNGST